MIFEIFLLAPIFFSDSLRSPIGTFQKENGEAFYHENLPIFMKIAERCWSELELISFSATCWEAVIFIALVLLIDNQIVISISLGPVLLVSDNFSCLDRNVTNLNIFKMDSLCLTKWPIPSSDPSAIFAHYFGLFFLTDSLSLAILFLAMFACIFLTLFDTGHSYKMLLMKQINRLRIFSLLKLCGKPNVQFPFHI